MKRKRWLLIFGLGFGLIFFWGSRPKHGKVIVKESDDTSLVSKIEQEYQNDYLSFNYEDNYEKRSEGNNLWLFGKARIPESFTLICRDFEGALDEDSGVLMRRVKDNEYTEREIVVDGIEGQYFEKNDLSERTIFILKDGIMITFSMTVNSNDEELVEKFEKIIESWQWKGEEI